LKGSPWLENDPPISHHHFKFLHLPLMQQTDSSRWRAMQCRGQARRGVGSQLEAMAAGLADFTAFAWKG
jgi:hypothetical protein